MGQKISTVALIPLRGGSKSIPLKNIKSIARRPLAYWTLDAAVNSKVIDKVYVATDSDNIRNVIAAYDNPKIEIIGRSPETCTDTASTESIMLEFAGKYEFEYIFLVQATSPLLLAEDIDGGFAKFRESGADSLLSVVEQKRFVWEKKGNFVEPSNYRPEKRPRRQDFEGFLVENGAFYLTSREALLRTKCRLSGRVACQIMREESYNELDEESDWKIIEAFLEKHSSK